MTVGKSSNNNAETSFPLNNQVDTIRAHTVIPAVDVNTVSNISLLPAAASFTAQNVHNQPTISSMQPMPYPLSPAQLLPLESPLYAPATRQNSAAGSTLQQFLKPSTRVQPYLAAPETSAATDFYLRVQNTLTNADKRPQENLTKIAQTKRYLAGKLSDFRLTPRESDTPATTLSSRAVTSTPVATVSGRLPISSCKGQRQSAAFTHCFRSGIGNSANDKYKFPDVNTHRFSALFPDMGVQTLLRLCHNWNTMDVGAVLIIYQSLKGKIPYNKLKEISAHDVFFHCFVDKTILDPITPKLSNMRFGEIRSETEVEPFVNDVKIGTWHRAVVSGECKEDFDLTSDYTSLSTLKEGGIVFRVVAKNDTYRTLHNNPATIEVGCTLADLLLAKAEIGRQINTVFQNRVFVRLPPGATVDCIILQKSSDKRSE